MIAISRSQTQSKMAAIYELVYIVDHYNECGTYLEHGDLKSYWESSSSDSMFSWPELEHSPLQLEHAVAQSIPFLLQLQMFV